MSTRRPRWRSRGVDLVLLGTAGSLATLLTGCSGNSSSYSNDYHRNVYGSAADCAADYGETLCVQKGEPQLGSRYLGPAFRMVAGRPSACHSSDPGPGRALNSPRIDIQRGGFGPKCSRRTSRRSYASGT
ncbi:MAG: hypothetical protein SFW09_19645 [Hyphomicrobiaceae bacterium]|nr:hypothetical protein [Hyphomicrobiaceae bacterium]